MRNSRSLAVGVMGVLGVSALIGWSMPSLAQKPRSSPPAPAREINPPVANCGFGEFDTKPESGAAG